MAEVPLQDLLDDDVLQQLCARHGDRPDVTIGLVDAEMRIRWASAPGDRAMFRRGADDYEGVGARYFVHPADFPAYEVAHHKALAGDVVEWEGRCSDGAGRWVWTSCEFHPLSSGAGTAVLARRGGMDG